MVLTRWSWISRMASSVSYAGTQTNLPLSSMVASSTRMPMVWYSGITPSAESPNT